MSPAHKYMSWALGAGLKVMVYTHPAARSDRGSKYARRFLRSTHTEVHRQSCTASHPAIILPTVPALFPASHVVQNAGRGSLQVTKSCVCQTETVCLFKMFTHIPNMLIKVVFSQISAAVHVILSCLMVHSCNESPVGEVFHI